MKRAYGIALVLLAIVLSSCGGTAQTKVPSYTEIESTLVQEGFSIDPNASCATEAPTCDKNYIHPKLNTIATVFTNGGLALTINVDQVDGKTDPASQVNSIKQILHKLYPPTVLERLDKYLADLYTPDSQDITDDLVVNVLALYDLINNNGNLLQIRVSIWPIAQPSGITDLTEATTSEEIPTAAALDFPQQIEPTPTPAEGTEFLIVDAQKSTWLDTGIFIQKSDKLQMESSGSIDFGGVQSGPDGSPDIEPGYGVVPTAPYGALVGMVGSGEPFVIGSHYLATAQSDGNLQLLINDIPEQYNDNSGQFQVTLTITKDK